MPINKRPAPYLTMVFWLLLLTGCAYRPDPGTIAALPVCRAHINGVDLGYRTLGQGPPLMMIMGYAGTMETWDPRMIADLSKHHRLILYDHRGAGASTIDASELTISKMAADALGLLDFLRIDQAHVMGWSMGAVIAQEMALERADRIKKLVLYATAVDPEPVQKALDAMAAMPPDEFVNRLFPEAWKTLNPDIYDRLPGPARVSSDVIRRQYRALTAWKGARQRLSALKLPVLILVGEEDRVTPLGQSLSALSLIPGAWAARFKGADHWLMYQAPEAVAKTVSFFLATEQDLLQAE